MNKKMELQATVVATHVPEQGGVGGPYCLWHRQ